MTLCEREMIEEIADIIGNRMKIDHYECNPARGYALTCHDDEGSHLVINHWGFVTSTGPWPAVLMNRRFEAQARLLRTI